MGKVPNNKASRSTGGFTLIELLVVISIIIFLMAMAIPGLSGFLKGRKLYSVGRLIESKFQQGRMAAVKKHVPHRLVLFKEKSTSGGRERIRYGVRLYEEGVGYADDGPLYLPKGTKFDILSQGLPVLEQQPEEDSPYFNPTQTAGRLSFLADGTIRFYAPYVDEIPPTSGEAKDLYNRNVVVSQVPLDTRADMVIEQEGTRSRCYVDVNPRTGRAKFRVVETAMGGAGTGGGGP